MDKRQPSENTDDSNMYIPAAGTKVLVLGLEKSGKSCLLAAMVNEETHKPYQPTPGFNAICITNINQRLDIMESEYYFSKSKNCYQADFCEIS